MPSKPAEPVVREWRRDHRGYLCANHADGHHEIINGAIEEHNAAIRHLRAEVEALRAEIADEEQWSDRCYEQQLRAEASEARAAALADELGAFKYPHAAWCCYVTDGKPPADCDCGAKRDRAALAPPAQDASEKEG